MVAQLQLLFFSALAFTFLKLTGIYSPELKSTNLDADWAYRKLMPSAVGWVARVGGWVWSGALGAARRGIDGAVGSAYRLAGPEGPLARTWKTGQIVFFAALMLGFYLLFYFL